MADIIATWTAIYNKLGISGSGAGNLCPTKSQIAADSRITVLGDYASNQLVKLDSITSGSPTITGVEIDGPSSIAYRNPSTLIGYAVYSDGSRAEISGAWSKSGSSINLSISSGSRVTASSISGSGTTDITFTSQGFTATKTITSTKGLVIISVTTATHESVAGYVVRSTNTVTTAVTVTATLGWMNTTSGAITSESKTFTIPDGSSASTQISKSGYTPTSATITSVSPTSDIYCTYSF